MNTPNDIALADASERRTLAPYSRHDESSARVSASRLDGFDSIFDRDAPNLTSVPAIVRAGVDDVHLGARAPARERHAARKVDDLLVWF